MSSAKLRKEKDCLNCGHIVEEHFCPHCGQENIVTKEDAFHMVTHAVADYFHFEHKFFGTIKPLLLKPGQLTKEYVAGKRMSSIHPIRLYIFISIVFFLVILSGRNKDKEEEKLVTTTSKTKLTAKQRDSLTAEKMKAAEEAIKFLPKSVGIRDSALKEIHKNIEKDNKFTNRLNWDERKSRKFTGNWLTKDSTIAIYDKNQALLPKEKRDGFIKHYIVTRSIELNRSPNPREKFIEDLLHNIPKMMFLLLPLFAMILKLVYINKGKYYYEHLIYSFHVHSALFLSVLFTLLLQWFFGLFYNIDGWLTFLCIVYMIWYVYRSLRTFYGSTRWVTILKIFFLSFSYNIVLTICFLIVIAVSFAMI